MLEEARLHRLGEEAPPLTSTVEVGVFRVTTVTRYEDILTELAELAELAELTPTSSELIELAGELQVPDDWWDEED